MTKTDQLISSYPELDSCATQIQAAFEILHTCFRGGGKVLTCDNGGSAEDAEHIVGELMKGYFLKRPVLEVIRARLASSSP